MRISLAMVLDCSADAAWEALHSPEVFQAVSAPFTKVESLEPGGFPERWVGGDHRVRLSLFGFLPMGTQLIRLHDEVRMLPDHSLSRSVHDTGGPLTGALRTVRSWHHRMTITATADGRAQFRDQLTVTAGAATPLVMLGFWVFWRLRGRKIAELAPGWKAPAAG